MGSGSKNKKGIVDMGVPGYNKKDWEAYHWCVRNNIAIAPKAKSVNEWYVVITNKDTTNQSPETYEKTVIWQKIFEYCKYYYEKYRK
jgi:hypothetical protein